jgi:hypothetical protein
MSDTPRTDNAILIEPHQVRELAFEVVRAHHMAELERELNEAKAKIAAFESERDQWRMSSVCRELRAELDEANTKLARSEKTLGDFWAMVGELHEANADRLRLRKALQWAFGQVVHRLESPATGHKGPCGYGDCDASCEDAYYWSQYYPLCEEALTTPPPPVVAKPDADALAEAVEIMRVGICSAAMPNATEREIASDAVKQASEVLKAYRNKYKEGKQ